MAEATEIRVDPANAGQARAWDGDEGAYWADNAERFDRAVAAYHGPFMAACRIARGERVLDIGCGTGQTTRDVMLVWQGPGPNEWVRELGGALAAGRNLPAPPPGAPGPFALADPGRTRTLLASAGFSEVTLDALHEPMWFGCDPDDAHRFVLGLMGWMLDGLYSAARKRALDALSATVSAHAGSDGITFASGAWLIRSYCNYACSTP